MYFCKKEEESQSRIWAKTEEFGGGEQRARKQVIRRRARNSEKGVSTDGSEPRALKRQGVVRQTRKKRSGEHDLEARSFVRGSTKKKGGGRGQ